MPSIFHKNGIRSTDFTINPSTITKLRNNWQEYAADIPPYPGNFDGRGIVICAGGLRYFTCSWIAVKMLRSLGCQLPIEIWYLGNELSEEIIRAFQVMNVTCRNFLENGPVSLSGFMLKPLSIIKSSFREVLFLDADNICVGDPTSLFSAPAYLEHGAMFWPDYWRTDPHNPIWEIIGSSNFNIPEQESGQILINKEKCWDPLNLCLYFNTQSNHYYEILYGDKDTFKFAWMALNKPFHMIQQEVGTCGYITDDNRFYGTTMVQHTPDNQLLFLHRNLIKWDVTFPNEKTWHQIKRFRPDAINKEYQIDYSSNGHFFVDLKGDVEILDFKDVFGDYEQTCLDFLNQLRSSDLFNRFVTYTHFATYRYIRSEPFTL